MLAHELKADAHRSGSSFSKNWTTIPFLLIPIEGTITKT